AKKKAAKVDDYVVMEASFGADLGDEKFLNIKSRAGQLKTDAVVIVATIRALKMHGGVTKEYLTEENVEALKAGMENLKKHIETIEQFGLQYVVSINEFPTDTENEVDTSKYWCMERNINV